MRHLIFFSILFTCNLFGQLSTIYPKDGLVTEASQISFRWNEVLDENGYQVIIAQDEEFLLNIDTLNTVETEIEVYDLPANMTYYWKVRSISNNIYSYIKSFTIIDLVAWDELAVFFTPENTVLTSLNKVSQWNDKSSNNLSLIQGNQPNRPYLDFDESFNNNSMIRFNGFEGNSLGGLNLSDLNENEIFMMLKINNVPVPNLNTSGIWVLGTNNTRDHYPYTNNELYLGYGGSARYNMGNPNSLVDLTLPHILNISSSYDSLKVRFNKNSFFNGTQGVPGFRANCFIGRSDNTTFLDGSIYEFLIFNTVLSDSLRNLVNDYIRYKYSPPVNLGADIISYSICDTVIYAGSYFKSYLWSDGSIADSLVVTKPGEYWVETIDVFGNVTSDTIMVWPNYFNSPLYSNICYNESLVWQVNNLENYSYLWSDGSVDNSITINQAGNYFVTVTDTNGCSFTTDPIYFTVDNYQLTASLGPDIDLCVGNQLGLSSGAEEAITYLWSTGATTPEIPISTSGEYSVVVTNINGCEAKDTVQVNIIGSAPAIAYSIPELICLNAEAEFLDGSTSTDGSTINTWEWLFLSDTLTSNNGTWQADSVGVFDIHYTIGTTAGCFSDTTFTLTVKPLPIVTMQSQGVCQGDEIQFYAGQLTPTLIDTWEWNFGESGSEAYGAEVEYVFSGNGNIPITLIGTDIYGCSDTLVQEQTISPKPNAAFYYTDICAGEVVNFANQTTIDYPGQLASRQWNFGDGTTSGQNNPQKPYASYGEYPVSLTVVSADGCSDYAEVLLKVNALPQVNYTYQQACARSSTQFTDASFVPNGSVADVKWSFNGQPPLSGFSVANTFNFPGTVQLKQTVKSAFGCSNAKETYIPIGPEIYAELSFSPNAFIVDQPVVFSSEGSGETSYAWDFGSGAVAGSSDTTVVFTEAQVGEEVTVTLIVSNAEDCRDSSSVTRIVAGREADLAIAEVFEFEEDGFLQLGARLKNVGAAPIEEVELTVEKPGFGIFKETWTGNLQAGEEEVYVFTASLGAVSSYTPSYQDYLCVEGRIVSAYLTEENLSNNRLCINLSGDSDMLVQVAPNPIDEVLRLKVIVATPGAYDLEVVDAAGRQVVALKEVQVAAGGDEVVLDARLWRVGVYRVRFGEVVLGVVKR